MHIGIPRGYFYYNCFHFIKVLLEGADAHIIFGPKNSDEVLERGRKITADETCMPVKLVAGQIDILNDECDIVIVPRIMKDMRGRWLCPEQLGIPELCIGKKQYKKTVVTEPVYFDDFACTCKSFRKLCSQIGIERKLYNQNFRRAYEHLAEVSAGKKRMHMEADWEFKPAVPPPGEIILPGVHRVLLAGHCYNVYDKFANGDIARLLNEAGIEAVTENDADRAAAERIFQSTPFIKKPFWEAFARIYGTVMSLLDEIDGVIYLSSFSCGIDSFTADMIRMHIGEKPFMVLKIDEHKGNAGIETRIEAFADILERRKAL